MKTFFDRTRRFPPILIRLLARYPFGAPRTTEDIARDGGLAVHAVEYYSQFTNWEGIDLPTAKKFMKGCHINLEDWKQMGNLNDFLKRGTWQFLKRSPRWTTYYQPLINRYIESVNPKS